MKTVLAIIGGSGSETLPGITSLQTLTVDTPFGVPSASITSGTLDDIAILFLPRHGIGHAIPPHQVNYRANICALKKLGATHVVSISAVGSMRKRIRPGDVVIVDQYIDLTKHRVSTFFEDGIVSHVSMADPVCPLLSRAALEAALLTSARVHAKGTYLCMEGPQFSTRAESKLYRHYGVDVIGMTAMPEAKLAREAQLPYATIAFATDYDCWRETEDAVTVDTVLTVLRGNAALAQEILLKLLHNLPEPGLSPCCHALENAIITASESRDPHTTEKLSFLWSQY